MPLGIAAAIGAVGSIGGGLLAGRSNRRAADTSARATRYAADLEQQRFDQNREDMAPWREAGTRALGGMQELMYGNPDEQMSSLRSTPGYQFRLDEGLKALTRSSLAGSVSGNTYRGLVEHGQNYATGEFDKQYNRLAGLAGTGQTATQFTSEQGAASAARQGNLAMRGADTQAAGMIGRGNIYGNTLGSLASMGGNMYQQYSSPSGGGGGYGGGGVAPGGSFGPSQIFDQAPDYGGNNYGA